MTYTGPAIIVARRAELKHCFNNTLAWWVSHCTWRDRTGAQNRIVHTLGQSWLAASRRLLFYAVKA
jgi:hypothetical protein